MATCCIYSFIGIKQHEEVSLKDKEACCIYSFIDIKQLSEYTVCHQFACCIYSFIGIEQLKRGVLLNVTSCCTYYFTTKIFSVYLYYKIIHVKNIENEKRKIIYTDNP